MIFVHFFLSFLIIGCLFFFLQCSLCDNSFCQQANLERHVRKHQESYLKQSEENFHPNTKMEQTSEEEEELEVDLETV